MAETEAPHLDFEMMLDAYVFASLRMKKERRTALVALISSSFSPRDLIGQSVRSLLGAKRSGRLDDAFDLLTLLGPTAEDFVLEVLQNAAEDDCSAAIDEDSVYVALRALGRRSPDLTSRSLLREYSTRRIRTLREAAVEALGDVNDEWARDLLREIAFSDSSELIRELATEERS